MTATASHRRPVLIAHADPVVSFGLKAILDHASSAAFETSVVAPDRLAERTDLPRDGLLVTDLATGLRIRQLAQQPGAVLAQWRVIVIATSAESFDVRAAMDCGIRGYLLSGSVVGALVEAAHLVARGSRYICPASAVRMNEMRTREVLTSRELEVLRYVVGGHANKEIANELDIAVGTVKAHVKSIFAKLGVNSRTQAACIAGERGILPNRRPLRASRRQPGLAVHGMGRLEASAL